MNRWLRITWALAAACFLALAVLSIGWLEPDGHKVFDSRLFGYSPEQAEAYLAALGPRARALYLGLFRGLDTVFPALLAVGLAGIILQRPRGAMRVLALGAVLLYLVADYSENALVAALLRGGPDAQTVWWASRATLTKWASLGGAAGLAALMAWRQGKGSR